MRLALPGLVVAVIGGLLAAVASGCGTAAPAGGCQSNSDCPGIRVCLARACVLPGSGSGGPSAGTGGATAGGGGAGTGGTGAGTGGAGTGGASTTATSGAGGGSNSAYCEHPTPTKCDCVVNQSPPNTEPCNPALLGGMAACCAGATWPQPGSSCACQPTDCVEANGACVCGNTAGLGIDGGVPVASCSPQAGQACCNLGSLCLCGPAATIAKVCGGQPMVPACASACPAPTVQVAACR